MNPNNEVIQIPIEDLVPNRFQPRISFDEKALNDLANSIKQHGIIQPLVVRRLGDKYEIIAGERRYKAAQIAGLITVPGLVADVNDQSSAEIALVENVQRKDLTSIEEAKSYKNILDKSDMTQEELAKKMGLSQSSVANKLRLLNLNEEVQQALLENKISERHARSLLTIEDPELQNKLLQRVLDERLTVRQLDEIINEIKNPVRDDVIDDVPLVDINENLEQMQREATDIAPEVSKVTYDEAPKTIPDSMQNDGKFFNFEVETEPETSPLDKPIEPEVQRIPEPEVQNIPSDPKPDDDFFNFEGTAPEAPAAEPTIQNIPDTNSEDNFFNFGNDSAPQPISDSNAAPVDTPEMMIEEVLDTENTENNNIETLDVEPTISIFDDHKDVSESDDLPDIINKIRNFVNDLNNPGIKIEEIDTEGSYKINIDIAKD